MSLEHLALFFLATLLLGILLGRVSSDRAHKPINAWNEGRVEAMKKSSKELLKLHEDFIRMHFDYVDVYGDVARKKRGEESLHFEHMAVKDLRMELDKIGFKR